jgi:hypothetical protein
MFGLPFLDFSTNSLLNGTLAPLLGTLFLIICEGTMQVVRMPSLEGDVDKRRGEEGTTWWFESDFEVEQKM